MQIIVCTTEEDMIVPSDILDPTSAPLTIKYPRIDMVKYVVPSQYTASVDGNDIVWGPHRTDEANMVKIVEVDEVPSDFAHDKYLYDGTTWTLNDNYTHIHPEDAFL